MDNNIQKSAIKKLVLMIYLSKDRSIDKIEQISIMKLAEAIVRIHENRPSLYLKSEMLKMLSISEAKQLPLFRRKYNGNQKW